MKPRLLTRRQMLAATAGAGATALSGAAHATTGVEPMKDDTGLWTQPWFLQSFFELRDDLEEAAAENKTFAVLWEQRGCPYCRELHAVNFADPEAAAFIKANFTILQLDFHGPRNVTDFDGKVMSEKELARRWRINFTPTINFFPTDPSLLEGKHGGTAEVARMPGYFKPFHFETMFEFVHGKHYKTGHFQAFLKNRADKMRAEGKTVVLW